MARKRKQPKFNKRTGELKGLKTPDNKGVAYLPSAKTIARRKHRPALHGKQRYPTGSLYNPKQQDDNNE